MTIDSKISKELEASFEALAAEVDELMAEYDPVFEAAHTPAEIAVVEAAFQRIMHHIQGVGNVIREAGERIRSGNV